MIKNALIIRLNILAFVICSALHGSAAEKGYGDWLDGYPTYPGMGERQILVLTNICRIAPESYRATWIGNYSILLPQNYPAVDPIYWHLDLNRSARAHSRDMANNHGINHSSSDQTAWDTRIKSYYTKSSSIGENIASGESDPFATMKQWLMDGNPPAADHSANDGHRENIMSSSYKEIGIGYAYGPVRYYDFWTQDFGGGTSAYTTPVSAGAHFVLTNNMTRFMATYKDPAGKAPVKAEVIVNNTPQTLSLLMGTAQRGAYSVSLAKAGDCRNYYFQFVTSQKVTCRYPQAGMLITLGEGNCDREYLDPDSNGIVVTLKNKISGFHDVIVDVGVNGYWTITVVNAAFMPDKIRILSSTGRIVFHTQWRSHNASHTIRQCVLEPLVPRGVYFLQLVSNGTACAIEKLIVIH